MPFNEPGSLQHEERGVYEITSGGLESVNELLATQFRYFANTQTKAQISGLGQREIVVVLKDVG